MSENNSIVRFKVGAIDIPIKINWMLALTELPEQFDIRICKLFDPQHTDGTQDLMQKLLLDDEYTLKLCWFFVSRKSEMTYDTFLNELDSSHNLESFREAFWAAAVNFSGPLKKGLMIEAWKEMKREVKNFSISKAIAEQSDLESEVVVSS